MRNRGKRAPTLLHFHVSSLLKFRRVVLALLIGSALAVNSFAADQEATSDTLPDRIAFVHLRIGQRSLEVLGTKITPGRLKPAAEHVGTRIALEVISVDGKPLWRGSIDDPALEKLETAAGSDHKHIKAAAVERENVETTIRVPFFEDRQTVRFSRVTPSSTSDATVTALGAAVIEQQ